MFYWMYRTEKKDAPLVIWLNGGPGASSQFGNFMLNGPMEIQKSNDDEWELNSKHTGSWADFANMVYVD